MGTAHAACNPVCARGSSSCPVAAAVPFLSSVVQFNRGIGAQCTMITRRERRVCVYGRTEGREGFLSRTTPGAPCRRVADMSAIRKGHGEDAGSQDVAHAVGLGSIARGSWRLEPGGRRRPRLLPGTRAPGLVVDELKHAR
jgi:hypothetical protein